MRCVGPARTARGPAVACTHALRPTAHPSPAALALRLLQASTMTIQPREHSSLAGWWQQPGGGTAAVPAASRLLAPCSLRGLPLVACPTVCCLPVADRPCTPSAGGPPGIDCSSPPAPVDTPAPPQRCPTSRFDALFMAAQQELGESRFAVKVVAAAAYFLLLWWRRLKPTTPALYPTTACACLCPIIPPVM